VRASILTYLFSTDKCKEGGGIVFGISLKGVGDSQALSKE